MRIHLVRSGESIPQLAKKYHVDERELRKINQLKEGSHLTPGMKLRIPSSAVKMAAAQDRTEAVPPSKEEMPIQEVKPPKEHVLQEKKPAKDFPSLKENILKEAEPNKEIFPPKENPLKEDIMGKENILSPNEWMPKEGVPQPMEKMPKKELLPPPLFTPYWGAPGQMPMPGPIHAWGAPGQMPMPGPIHEWGAPGQMPMPGPIHAWGVPGQMPMPGPIHAWGVPGQMPMPGQMPGMMLDEPGMDTTIFSQEAAHQTDGGQEEGSMPASVYETWSQMNDLPPTYSHYMAPPAIHRPQPIDHPDPIEEYSPWGAFWPVSDQPYRVQPGIYDQHIPSPYAGVASFGSYPDPRSVQHVPGGGFPPLYRGLHPQEGGYPPSPYAFWKGNDEDLLHAEQWTEKWEDEEEERETT